MTLDEYQKLPANIQRDVALAVAIGYKLEVCTYSMFYSALKVKTIRFGNISRGWSFIPTIDPTIWGALLSKDWVVSVRLCPAASGWLASSRSSFASFGDTPAEAICNAVISADKYGYIKAAGLYTT